MKMAIVSLALILLVTGIAVTGYVKVCVICDNLESFAEKIDSRTNYGDAEAASKKWEKDKMLLGMLVPSQSLNAVTASFSLLSESLKSGNSDGVYEAKSQISAYAGFIKDAESVSFTNIF